MEKFHKSLEVGYGVRATRPYKAGEYVASYLGELIDMKELRKREETLYANESKFYTFVTGYKGIVVDATAKKNEWGLGLYINHSLSRANLEPRLLKRPHVEIQFFASRDIASGEEFLFDYGDRTLSFD